MSVELKYRTIYVVVPRAHMSTWAHQSWTDVLAAAERGVDGLTVQHGRPRLWQGPQMGPPPVPDVAYLAEGQHEWVGKTVLHQ